MIWMKLLLLILNRMKLSFLIYCIFAIIVAVMFMSVEGFGMSPGTLVQLQSTSVPSSMGYMGPPYFLR
jgi:hypothetical protein